MKWQQIINSSTGPSGERKRNMFPTNGNEHLSYEGAIHYCKSFLSVGDCPIRPRNGYSNLDLVAMGFIHYGIGNAAHRTSR